MIYEMLEDKVGCAVIWEKYNTSNGKTELLNGTLAAVRMLPELDNLKCVVIEDEHGKQWKTVPEMVRNIVY